MAKAKVTITASNQMSKGIKSAEQELTSFQKVADKVGASLKSAFSVAAIAVAVKAVVNGAKECTAAFKKQLEAETKLENALKATNKQYEISAESMKSYAKELQNTTRFGDEAILEAQALLVATEKLNQDGLEKTISLSADLAEAMGTDITSAAQTLAKVLQDPTTGLNRLKTIGVTFTAQEKEQINALMEANDLYAAQDIILGKVQGKYEGLAEAIASTPTGTLDKISNVIGDIKEDLGKGLVYSLAPAFDWILKQLQKIEQWANQLAQKSEFKYSLKQGVAGNTNLLADNFTTEYLREELSKRNDTLFDELVKLEEDYWLNTYLKKGNVSLQDFLEMQQDQQIDLLMELSNNDALFVGMVQEQLVTYNKAYAENAALTTAIAKQEAKVQSSLDEWFDSLAANAGSASFLKDVGWTQFDKYSWYDKNSMHNWQLNFGVGPSATLNAAFGKNGNLITSQVLSQVTQQVTSDSFVSKLSSKLGVTNEQSVAALSAVSSALVSNLGEAGELISKLATNMSTMGPLLGAIATALEYVLQGFGETLKPILNDVVKYGLEPLREIGRVIATLIKPLLEELMPLFQDSADSFMKTINMLGAALSPVIHIITTILSPILDQLCNTLKMIEPVITIVAKAIGWVAGTIAYFVDLLQALGSSVLNWIAGFHIGDWRPFEGLRVQNKGMPEDYDSYIKKYVNGVDTAAAGVSMDTSTQTAVSSASYRGATAVTINIYAEGPIVGDGGMRQFAQMIREEFDALNYYGVTA